jgi:hypothetical protein
MSDDAKYEERYCAFVDILGFRELISEVKKQTDQYKRLRALLGKLPRISIFKVTRKSGHGLNWRSPKCGR